MKKLLFITPELPYPLQSGGKVKTFKLLQSLAERYEVTLVCPLKNEDADHRDAFHRVSPCVAHVHQRVNVPRTAWNLSRSYLNGIPLNVWRTVDWKLKSAVAHMANRFDVVFLDHYESATFLPARFRGLRVYHAHNAYHQLWRRYAAVSRNPLVKFAATLEALRVRRFETRTACTADLVFAAPNDGRELVAAGVPEESIRETFHLGDEHQLGLPDLAFSRSAKKLLYVGYLGWEPNVQGLLWFIEQVWPRLLKTHPRLRLDIVGKDPDLRLQCAVAAHAGIRLTGFIDDLEAVYGSARVSIAPLLFGSGMKVKVLDAMARGMPTVTTSIGVEGIDASHGEHLLVSDDPAEFADQINLLLQDEALWHRLSGNSRTLIRARYTWNQLLKNMHWALKEALWEHQARRYRPTTPARLTHAA